MSVSGLAFTVQSSSLHVVSVILASVPHDNQVPSTCQGIGETRETDGNTVPYDTVTLSLREGGQPGRTPAIDDCSSGSGRR